jgi:hypothetical protein
LGRRKEKGRAMADPANHFRILAKLTDGSHLPPPVVCQAQEARAEKKQSGRQGDRNFRDSGMEGSIAVPITLAGHEVNGGETPWQNTINFFGSFVNNNYRKGQAKKDRLQNFIVYNLKIDL